LSLFGEATCEMRGCTRRAYYRETGGVGVLTNKNPRVLCGTHSRKRPRKKLTRNPNAKRIRKAELDAHKAQVARAAAERGGPGMVTCFKLRMMRVPPLTPGVMNVFPNNRHQARADGFGCAALSPMRLGPVRHGQFGLGDALNIENYHQFNKCFPFEQEDGTTLPIFYQKRDAAYADPVAHRHKYDPKQIRKMSEGYVTGGRVEATNAPMFSVHLDATGKERHYSYVQSRFFYCAWHERLAKKEPYFAKLLHDLERGTNLCLVGYDAYQPTGDLYEHYCDPGRPFGHELVLYTLLVVKDPNAYPWRRYYAEHCEIYDPLPF